MRWAGEGRGRGWVAGRARRTLAALAGAGALLGASPAAAQPGTRGEDRAADVEAAALAAGAVPHRHRGYPAVELTALVGRGVSGVTVRGTEARARAEGGLLVLRAGSPFVRHEAHLFQLANPPYMADGRFWVPLELFSGRHRGTPQLSGPEAGPAGEPGATAPSRRQGPWRVVIDAGHGGHDPGAVNRRTGAREKEITLGIARRVRDLLARRPGFEPILTREDDRFLRLAERSRLATSREADLFVSIHVNAQERGSTAYGFETYFLSQARTEESRRVAMRENSVLELEGDADPATLSALQYILASLEQNGNVQESSRFAGYVQNEMRRQVPGDDRGVKQAGFYVLMGATGSMPAVLVEAGFITNPRDERFLRSATGQEKIAYSLDRAIAAYFEEVDRRLQRLSAAGAE